MARTIFHCDCNGFYASVECIFRPELKRVPMAVCGDPRSRHGIILAKNELAKSFGVQTAETVWQAKRKCPELVLVAAHHDAYQAYSQKVNAIYAQYTDQVEPFGVDESWLDMTGSLHLFGPGPQVADQLRERVKRELGLTISVGVSFNKIFAKLGSDYRKPDATTVITEENYRAIVHPLPVSELLYVGDAAAAQLHRYGIDTIGQLAQADPEQLTALLGKSGHMLYAYANGLEDSPVASIDERRPAKSIGNGITFRRNLVGVEDVRAGILALSDSVAARLRQQGLYCHGVQLQIKDPNLRMISRQKGLSHGTFLAQDIAACALELARAHWPMTKPIRMMSVTAMQLSDTPGQVQLSLLDPTRGLDPRRCRLEQAMDRVRARYGRQALSYASLMDNDILMEPRAADEDRPEG
ncbi:MAG: DNA polymerase IV [Christensenellales bacterium]|jgi:DNA polymerase-4